MLTAWLMYNDFVWHYGGMKVNHLVTSKHSFTIFALHCIVHTGLNWDIGVHGDFFMKIRLFLIWIEYEFLYTIYVKIICQVSSNLTSFWLFLCKGVFRKPIKITWKWSTNKSILPFLELRPSNYPCLDKNNWL